MENLPEKLSAPVPESSRPARLRWATIGAGFLCIVLGVASGFVPVIPGWLLIFTGLVLLARELPWARRIMKKLRSKFPRLAHKLDEAEEKMRSWFS